MSLINLPDSTPHACVKCGVCLFKSAGEGCGQTAISKFPGKNASKQVEDVYTGIYRIPNPKRV